MSPTCVTPTRYLLEEQGERRMERRKIKRLGNEVGSCRQRDEEWRAEGGALWSGFVPIHTGRTEVLSHSRAQRPSLFSSFALPCPNAWSKCIPAPTIMAGPDSSKTNFSSESLSGFLSSMTCDWWLCQAFLCKVPKELYLCISSDSFK